MRGFVILACSLLISVLSFGQETELEIRKKARTLKEYDLVVESSRLIQENYLYFAGIITDKLLEFQPQSSNYNYRKGYIILKSTKDAQKAIPYLEKAILKTHKNYDMFSTGEQNASFDAFFHLGCAYHLDGQIGKAIEMFNKYTQLADQEGEMLKETNLFLQQCNIASQLMENPKKVKVINLGKGINSSFPEYSPFISLDGSALYFTSRRSWDEHSTEQYKDPTLNDHKEDIYVSYKNEDGTWSEPKRLDFCEDERNEASISVSPDERRVYIYQDNKGGGDIFYSDFKLNAFDEIKDLKYTGVNSPSWETHCTMTIDGLQMYFVSDRPGGLGGRDIYRVVKLPNGEWSLPQNLGPTINTSYEEDCPFIAADNKTLYFSSNGPKSMGDFDIFFTIRDENGIWQEPLNLGYPINSTGLDAFYTTTIDGSRGYLTSYRTGGFGEKDLYEIQNDYLGHADICVLKGKIHTKDNKPLPVDISISLKNLSFPDRPELELKPRLRDGSFFNTLEPCSEYEIVYKKRGSTEITRAKFNTSCDKRWEEIYQDILLDVENSKTLPLINYDIVGTVLDKKSKAKISESSIIVYNVKDNKIIDSTITSNLGEFISTASKGKYYGDVISIKVKIQKENYLTQEFEFNHTLDTTKLITMTFELEKKDLGIDLAKTLNLKPIYFDLGKSNIRPDAKIELDKIVKVMNDNPEIHVELGSHTDCRSSAEFNMNLSDKRAKSSADYIKKRISNPERITGKGYGESQLVNKCECEGDRKVPCSEKEHQENRRTEFKIIAN